MRRRGSTRLVLVLSCTVLAGSAVALDRPVEGRKLLLRSVDGREKLIFLTRDTFALFPVPGTADDPATGTPGGLVVELFSPAASKASPPATCS